MVVFDIVKRDESNSRKNSYYVRLLLAEIDNNASAFRQRCIELQGEMYRFPSSNGSVSRQQYIGYHQEIMYRLPGKNVLVVRQQCIGCQATNNRLTGNNISVQATMYRFRQQYIGCEATETIISCCGLSPCG